MLVSGSVRFRDGSVFSLKETHDLGVPQNLGVPFWGVPIIRDYSILGSILGSPYFGKLAFNAFAFGGRALNAAAQLLVFQLDQKRVVTPRYTIHPTAFTISYVSHSLNSLKGGYMGDYIGDYHRGY